MQTNSRKMVSLAILSAIAYIVMLFLRFPIVSFLKYDPKDAVITIGGFIFGPISALMMSISVSVIEMFTVSATGPIGLIMNVVSTCAFAITAAAVYKKVHTIKGALLGLGLGMIIQTSVMLLWNYYLTPLYMGYPREEVSDMLIPVFLPFNLIKSGLNAAITMLLYKPVVQSLRRANLVPEVVANGKTKLNPGVLILSILILISCIMFVAVLSGLGK